MDIKELRENKVFNIFYQMNQIPRGSGNEKQVSDWLVNWAKERNLEVYQDKVNNVIIKKPATKGYENADTIIMQGHMDMVCSKEKESKHDFLKDPIDMYVDGDWLKAKETTLGADNGIGVSIILAILEDNELEHPSLEGVFTVEEETTMLGAKNIDASLLKGKKLISLDGAEEGEIEVSSAGMVTVDITDKVEYLDCSDLSAYKVVINGLASGHSGVDIGLGRANSICILGRLLSEIKKEVEFKLADIEGGVKSNVIPFESEAVILIDEDSEEKVENIVNRVFNEEKEKYAATESGMNVFVEKCDANKAISDDLKDRIINYLVKTPNAVQKMSQNIEGLVETSLNNAILKIEDGKFLLNVSIRSSVKQSETEVVEMVRALAKENKFEFEITSTAPPMEYVENSRLREVCVSTYKKLYNEDMRVVAIHAGLEGGVFAEKIPALDSIVMAPNLRGEHSTKEKVNIPSTIKVYEFVKEVLKELK